jgi:hypothetical protein
MVVARGKMSMRHVNFGSEDGDWRRYLSTGRRLTTEAVMNLLLGHGMPSLDSSQT